MQLSESQFDRIAGQTGPTLVGEASSLGIPPGQWPREIGLSLLSGGTCTYEFHRNDQEADGEIAGKWYRPIANADGLPILIIND